MRGDELHVTTRKIIRDRAVEEGTIQRYDFDRNVTRQNLHFREQEAVEIRSSYLSPDDNSIKVPIKEDNGTQVDLDALNSTCRLENVPIPQAILQRTNQTKEEVEEEARKFLRRRLEEINYEGLDGWMETWLEPSVTYGYIAELCSQKRPELNGRFLIKRVEVKGPTTAADAASCGYERR